MRPPPPDGAPHGAARAAPRPGDDPGVGRRADEVRRDLLAAMATGALVAGQRIGGERALAVELGVSRSTLRQALAALEADGAVRRTPGRGGGTFVTASSVGKVDRDLSRIIGVPELLRDQGFTSGSKVVSASVVAADAATARALRLAPGAFVCEVTRIRLADAMPISLETARLPAARFAGLLELPLGGSLYQLLDERYGVRPSEADERIEVVPASADQGRVLGVATGAPLLAITRTSLDETGTPIEHSHDLFRADRTRITVRTRGASSASCTASGTVVAMRTRAV